MVTGAYYPEISGGAVQCRSLIQALHGAVSFAVVTTVRDRTLPRRQYVDGVPVWRIPVFNGSMWEWCLSVPRFVWALFSSAFPHQIFHLHGFSLKSILAILVAKVTRKRVLVAIHTLGYDEPLAQRRFVFGRFRIAIYGGADCFVAVSPALSSRYLAAGFPPAKLVEIPNGVDTARFRPPADEHEKAAIRERLELPGHLPVILFVGFFSMDKGPHVMAKVWLSAREEGVRSFLLMVGSTDTRYHEVDGGLVASVRGLVGDVEYRDDVRFVERTLEMDEYYRAGDVFVLPSLREGCPMALLEAMATGLPCVVSRLEGATDVIIQDGRTGVLVRPGDVEAFARGVAGVLRDRSRARCLGRAAREVVEERYSLSRMASAYRECYRDLVEGPRNAHVAARSKR